MPSPLVELQCACATARRTARLVTQLYSAEMGGLAEPSQFALLTALSKRPGTTQAGLGRALGLDKTTMSRNLRVMRKHRWIAPAPSDDLRERGYSLTPAGMRLLAAARPGWQRAQRKLRAALKLGEWETMLSGLNRVAEAALAAGGKLIV